MKRTALSPLSASRRLLLGLLQGFLLFCLPAVCHAQLDFVLAPASPTIHPGDTPTTLSATFTNSYSYPVFLNGLDANADSPLVVDTQKFNDTFIIPNNPPTIPANGGTLTADILTFAAPSNAPLGDYQLILQFSGGQHDTDSANIGPSKTLIVHVSAIPEASTLATLGLGLAGLNVGLLRRRRA